MACETSLCCEALDERIGLCILQLRTRILGVSVDITAATYSVGSGSLSPKPRQPDLQLAIWRVTPSIP